MAALLETRALQGDSHKSARNSLSAKNEPAFVALDRARRVAGISQNALCARAGVALRTYVYALANPDRLRPTTLRQLETALRSLQRGAAKASGPGTDAARDMVRAVIGGFLVAAAASHGVTAEEVRATLDGSEERTSNERWRACSHARQAAIYLTNTSLGIEQARIADALGLTPAAVCLAIRSVETRRDAAAVDAALNGAEFAITGRAGF